MKIIACLGNPEKKYAFNRHNIGFAVGDYLAGKFGVSVNKNSFSSFCGSGKIDGVDVLFLFPQTYMNNSGKAVAAAKEFYHSEISDIIAIHDELEIPFGSVNVKKGGGHKGHNGIRSIASSLGSADFYRLRFGIGRPVNTAMSIADYVLSNFSDEERVLLNGFIENVETEFIKIIQDVD